MPLVSVLMSVFNGEKSLKKAIESILSQTFKNFEFIIIDDGSFDQTANIIRSFKDDRIVPVFQSNIGLTASLNKGIGLSKTNYIVRQDADDYSYPERLTEQYEIISKNPSIAVLASKALIINKKLEYVSKFYSTEEITNQMKSNNVFVHSSVIIRKDKFREVGFYNEKYLSGQDYDAWLRLSSVGVLKMIDKVLVVREINENSISKKKLLEQCINGFKIRYNNNISIFKNVYCTLYMLLSNLIPAKILHFIKLKYSTRK